EVEEELDELRVAHLLRIELDLDGLGVAGVAAAHVAVARVLGAPAAEADAGRDDALPKPELGLDAPESTGGEAGDLGRRPPGGRALHLEQRARRGLGGAGCDAGEEEREREVESTHVRSLVRRPGPVSYSRPRRPSAWTSARSSSSSRR